MSEIIDDMLRPTFDDLLNINEEFQGMIREEIKKFFGSTEWKDMLYDYMQDVLNEDLDIIDFVEQEAKNILMPRIRKALEAI